MKEAKLQSILRSSSVDIEKNQKDQINQEKAVSCRRRLINNYNSKEQKQLFSNI